jgi:hypothetical protein
MNRVYPLTAGIGVLLFFTYAKLRSALKDIISIGHTAGSRVPGRSDPRTYAVNYVDAEDYGTPVAPV